VNEKNTPDCQFGCGEVLTNPFDYLFGELQIEAVGSPFESNCV
jgi:hypothetical protein